MSGARVQKGTDVLHSDVTLHSHLPINAVAAACVDTVTFKPLRETDVTLPASADCAVQQNPVYLRPRSNAAGLAGRMSAVLFIHLSVRIGPVE